MHDKQIQLFREWCVKKGDALLFYAKMFVRDVRNKFSVDRR